MLQGHRGLWGCKKRRIVGFFITQKKKSGHTCYCMDFAWRCKQARIMSWMNPTWTSRSLFPSAQLPTLVTHQHPTLSTLTGNTATNLKSWTHGLPHPIHNIRLSGRLCGQYVCPSPRSPCHPLFFFFLYPSPGKMLVVLRDGRKLHGVLRSYDQFGSPLSLSLLSRIFERSNFFPPSSGFS